MISLGGAKGTRSSRAGANAALYLTQAVDAFRSTLQVYTREQLPQYWATTESNLGSALEELARRSEGEKAALLGHNGATWEILCHQSFLGH